MTCLDNDDKKVMDGNLWFVWSPFPLFTSSQLDILGWSSPFSHWAKALGPTSEKKERKKLESSYIFI